MSLVSSHMLTVLQLSSNLCELSGIKMRTRNLTDVSLRLDMLTGILWPQPQHCYRTTLDEEHIRGHRPHQALPVERPRTESTPCGITLSGPVPPFHLPLLHLSSFKASPTWQINPSTKTWGSQKPNLLLCGGVGEELENGEKLRDQ